MDSYQGNTILVVDDCPTQRYLMSELISKFGLSIMEAESGHRAVSLLSVFKFGGMFLDLRMPDLDGFSVLKLNKGVTPTAIVTNKDLLRGERTSLRLLGAKEVIERPLTLPLIHETLEILLNRRIPNGRQIVERIEGVSLGRNESLACRP